MVRWCGGWPLVTRLLGTRLAARPWQSVESIVDDLDDLASQILDDDPRSVRAALAGAYSALTPAAAYLFGRLGRRTSSSIVLHKLSTTPDGSVRRIRRLLQELAAEHLIVEVGPDHYRIHDVVRRFARQCDADLMDRDAVDGWVGLGGLASDDAAA